MLKERSVSSATNNHSSKRNRSFLKWICHKATLPFLAVLALLLPSSLMAGPILVRIDDSAFGPPNIQVFGVDPSIGYNIYVGPNVNSPGIEDGGLITLFGVDQQGTIPAQSGRFVDPTLPATATRNARDIVWIEHDYDFFFTGDLRIGFNSAHKGTWYFNPNLIGDINFGPVKPFWFTCYSNAAVVVQFKGPILLQQ